MVHDIWLTMFNQCYKTLFFNINFKIKGWGRTFSKHIQYCIADNLMPLLPSKINPFPSLVLMNLVSTRLKGRGVPWYHLLGETLMDSQ